jgi:hypothetical protein
MRAQPGKGEREVRGVLRDCGLPLTLTIAKGPPLLPIL